MNWSEEKEPNKEVSYNHVTLDTPLGIYTIDWKGWKERPSYDISLGDDWIGTDNTLESSKEQVEIHIKGVADELNKFLEK